MKWWEKTVEYKFVIDASKITNLFIAPLDGNEEIAGDAIININAKWLLIEFKKDISCLKMEENKFKNYQFAKEQLEKHDSHHLLVFGSNEENPGELTNIIATYFSRQTKTMDTVFQSGIKYELFKKYIEYLSKQKKDYNSLGSSGGKTFNSSYDVVIGVNTEKKATYTLTLDAFERYIGIKRTIERRIEIERDGMSR